VAATGAGVAAIDVFEKGITASRGSVAADLPQRLFRLLGAWYQWFAAPSAGTLRRVPIEEKSAEQDRGPPEAGHDRPRREQHGRQRQGGLRHEQED
jgi:hypothetical protein